MKTEVWPRANRAVVTNSLTVIIKVVFIEGFMSLKCIKHPNLHQFFAAHINCTNQGLPVLEVSNWRLSVLLASFLCFFAYFILAVPMQKCFGQHLCMSSHFLVILNGTGF